MINKFVIVISLWLIAIVGITIFLSVETKLIGFRIAAMVVAIILFSINALHISLRIRKALRLQPKQAKKLNR